jgi:hypothetical protein
LAALAFSRLSGKTVLGWRDLGNGTLIAAAGKGREKFVAACVDAQDQIGDGEEG